MILPSHHDIHDVTWAALPSKRLTYVEDFPVDTLFFTFVHLLDVSPEWHVQRKQFY